MDDWNSNRRTFDQWKSQSWLVAVNDRYLVCDICHKYSDVIIKCAGCSKRFGKNCGIKSEYLCKYCINFDEVEHLLPKIFTENTCIQDINLINVIISYYKGYIVSCCNQIKCNNEICIDNPFEFFQTKDLYHFQKPYYWYAITKKQKLFDITIRILFNLQIRIFCRNCYKYLHRCRFLYSNRYQYRDDVQCKNTDIIIKDGVPIIDYSKFSDSRGFNVPVATIICKQHIYCEICGDQQEINREGEYNHCSQFGTSYCFLCGKLYDKCCGYKYYNVLDSGDDYDKHDEELAKYDNDPVFIKTCKPYKYR